MCHLVPCRVVRHVLLRELQSSPMAFDVACFVAQRRVEISTTIETKAASARVMSVAVRMKCESLRSQCDGDMLRAKELQAAFWGELSARSPSLQRLEAIGSQLQRSIRRAELAFERLLALSPSSSTTLARFSEFMMDVSV
jgi:hypothetical protein